MTNKPAPRGDRAPASTPDYTALNLTPAPKPPGAMAVLLSIPITPRLTAGQRARAQLKPRVKVHTLDILRSQHATVDVVAFFLDETNKPYTRIRTTKALHNHLLHDAARLPVAERPPSTINTFMGLPVVLLTEEEYQSKMNPAPRAKRSTLTPRRDYSLDERRAQAAKNRNAVKVNVWNPVLMTMENIRGIVRQQTRRRRLPHTEITMSGQCRDKLWAEAVAHTDMFYEQHPDMPDENTFMGLPIRTIAVRESWGDGQK